MDKKKKIKTVSAACFVLICGVVYVWLHWGRQGKEPVVWEPRDAVGETAGTVTGQTEQNEEQNTSDPGGIRQELYVHICGAVAVEGVYTLPEGSRLIDCVTAAGGFLPVADTSYHNLAALLSDGQKVYIPTVEETKEVSVSERTESAGTAGALKTEETGTSVQQAKVNINTAGLEELTTLSGIGESKAKSILQYREKVGAFQRIEELKNVSGIGDAMFERVKEDITVE